MKIVLFFLKNFFFSRRFSIFRYDFLFMLIGLFISVSILTATMSIFEGFEKALRNLFLISTPHLSIFNLTENEKEKLIKQEKDQIESAAEIVEVGAVVTNGNRSKSCFILGLNPSDDIPIDFKSYVNEGNSNLKNGIVIGHILAENLSINIGDKISIYDSFKPTFSQTGLNFSINKYKVVGFYNSGFSELDQRIIFMDKKDVTFENKISYLGVKLKKNSFIENPLKLKFIKDLKSPIYVRSWKETNIRLFKLLQFQKFMLFLVLLLLVFVASFGVVSSITSLILESKKEIGILKVLGIKNRRLKQIFVLKVFIVGVFTTIIAQMFGYAISYFLSIQKFYLLNKSVYLTDRIQMDINLKMSLIVFSVTVVIIYIACIIPIKKFDRISVMDILRNI